MRSLRQALMGALASPQFLPACFAAFVGIRLALILLVPVAPFSDAQWYVSRAVTLLETGSYTEQGSPTAYWPVGYPAFLALLYRLTGPSILAAQFANLAFAAISFWLLYLCARKLIGDELSARGAALLFTIYPNHIAYVPLTVTEPMYVCLVLGAVLLLLRCTWGGVVLAGLVCGLGTLIKTQTILLAPGLAFVLWCEQWSVRAVPRATGAALLVAALALAVVAPWSVRNYLTFGEFVLVSTNGGMTLLTGNNPSLVGNYAKDYVEDDPLVKEARFSVRDQAAADRRARELAGSWIRDNKGDFLRLIPQKVFRLWAIDGEAEWSYQAGTPWYDEHRLWFRAVRIVNQIFYVAVLLLFAAAAVLLARRRAPPYAWCGFAIAAFFTALCAVFSGQSRYHFPVMAFALIYAAWVVLVLMEGRGAERRPGSTR